ncbi:hypothetical protein BbiDN127_E0022 (plasmid) [Borreliella bissettiae DN127]|uniref:Uncharacterized protein n=1 Tax=Borrelia bissettiae (strain DSM 17990 / CIP 109136 / DN127) TaxID=521010 RepID=G0AP33_BORBD|nr:hypothetical protein BbiDN127_E0022 [Borreliella bissettiae DN127]
MLKELILFLKDYFSLKKEILSDLINKYENYKRKLLFLNQRL